MLTHDPNSLSAIFVSMTSQYTQSRKATLSPERKQVLLQSVKYKLLALREFEERYVLAKWIRQLFVDVFDREQPAATAQWAAAATADGGVEDVAADRGTGASSTAAMENIPDASAPNFPITTDNIWQNWPLAQDLSYLDSEWLANTDFD
jgi:hypothetical protein